MKLVPGVVVDVCGDLLPDVRVPVGTAFRLLDRGWSGGMECFGIVEGVDDKSSEGVGEVLEREEGLLAVVGGVEGDLVSLFECSVRRRCKGVLGRLV